MKIKKPKKKELVELETLMVKYYHKRGFLDPRYIKEITTRKDAEKRGYRICSYCFGVNKK